MAIEMALGRKVDHDPRSRLFRAQINLPPVKSVQHPTFGAVLDQGRVGACTGFAAAHSLNTGKLKEARSGVMVNKDGLAIYSKATELDTWPGKYPPDDDGSSVLAAMKAMKAMGLITSYSWAFGISDVLGSIATTPIVVGTDWYSSFFNPDKNGKVKISGKVVGGHAYLLSGYQVLGKSIYDNLFWFRNSWGVNWSVIGGFCMTVRDFEKLLARKGECVIPAI